MRQLRFLFILLLILVGLNWLFSPFSRHQAGTGSAAQTVSTQPVMVDVLPTSPPARAIQTDPNSAAANSTAANSTAANPPAAANPQAPGAPVNTPAAKTPAKPGIWEWISTHPAISLLVLFLFTYSFFSWRNNRKLERELEAARRAAAQARAQAAARDQSDGQLHDTFDREEPPYWDRDDSWNGSGNGFADNMNNENHTKNPAVLVLPGDANRKSFKDVAGQPEAVLRLAEVCRWLKNPDVYNRHDAKLPRGILLSGPPGTGKTLLARALAGEADASMYITAGSAFVEVYVGVGAGRVRALFDAAKQQRKRTNKPVIIFIDEIDAVGGQRGTGTSSNSEREQTLNQLLTEMDGFTKNEGIIVVAATNRPDMLDSALRRKGRFDLDVPVEMPDTFGREAIFKVHSQAKPLAADVDFAFLARRTFGFSGADIEAICNEAAILAARKQQEKDDEKAKATAEAVSKVLAPRQDSPAPDSFDFSHLQPRNNGTGQNQYGQHGKPAGNNGSPKAAPVKAIPEGEKTPITTVMFDEAISIVEAGEARHSRLKAMKLIDKQQTAYHELGHAIVNIVEQGDPITKITILPRGRALGYVQTHSEGDRFSLTDQDMRRRITMTMAGRIAQEVFMQTIDTGAANDFKQANETARLMVTEYGMSPLGAIYVPADRSVQLGPDLANAIDSEVRSIVSDCGKRARSIIERHRNLIESLCRDLVEKETILGPELMDMYEKAVATHCKDGQC